MASHNENRMENSLKQVRVVIITHAPSRGGTERSAITLAAGLKQIGCEVMVLFTLNDQGPLNQYIHNHQIKTRLISAASLEADGEMIKKWKPSLINFQILRQDFDFLPYFRGLFPNLPFIETNIFSDVKIYSHYFNLSLQLSLWCKLNYLAKFAGVQKPPAETLPYPIEGKEMFKASKSEIAEFRKKYEIPEASWYGGRVGQPSEEKWNTGLIEDLKKILIDESDGQIIFIGAPPSHHRAVEGLPISLRKRFHFLPLIDDRNELRAFYSSLSVFLHYSTIGESFGLVLTEAMLCECPVITRFTPLSDNTQIEILEHKKRGWVIETGADLGPTIRSIIRNKKKTSQVTSQGKSYVLKMFSPIRVAGLFLKNSLKFVPSKNNLSLNERIKLEKLSLSTSRRSLLIWLAMRHLLHCIKQEKYSVNYTAGQTIIKNIFEKVYKISYGA